MKPVIYCGPRVYASSICHLFVDEKREHYYFGNMKFVYIGNCYKMLAGDKMKRRPESIDPAPFQLTEKELRECETQKLIVKAFRDERKKAMQLKKPPEKITVAINLLRPYFQSVTWVDQKRFLAYLQQEMSKKGKK